ncbi:hypothetical protein MJO28_015408 [Puccinia striiformis f. sp. tritici]|uniref:Uncharacterized protein n=1 Tax=Puccinia striiformis f. sp. tritici TaxID=168172 RepID=A0ACC0DVF0_9BASI|nr:hypothetical protein MJO29_015124 [Puccinia striiformis f. sp. tritici]KAI7938488.1 hypothetical protein MJO28_015408 [Puccinia striiformis f. sp. tritici]
MSRPDHTVDSTTIFTTKGIKQLDLIDISDLQKLLDLRNFCLVLIMQLIRRISSSPSVVGYEGVDGFDRYG